MLGTYLVNYAGFGMITDLRNDLYNAVLRQIDERSFRRHYDGVAAVDADQRYREGADGDVGGDGRCFCSRCLHARSSWPGVVVFYGGKLSWVLLLFVPVVISSARRIGRKVRQTTRKGQDKLAEIQNILHETITGNRDREGVWDGAVGDDDGFAGRRGGCFSANLRSVSVQAISSPLDGCAWAPWRLRFCCGPGARADPASCR